RRRFASPGSRSPQPCYTSTSAWLTASMTICAVWARSTRRSLLCRLQLREQRSQQRGAFGQDRQQNMLVIGVRAVTDTAQPVKRWHTKRGSEIAVRPAASKALLQLEAEAT